MEATLTGANDRAGFKGERAKVDAHHWMQAVDGDQNDKADEEECLTLLQYMQQMLGGFMSNLQQGNANTSAGNDTDSQQDGDQGEEEPEHHHYYS